MQRLQLHKFMDHAKLPSDRRSELPVLDRRAFLASAAALAANVASKWQFRA